MSTKRKLNIELLKRLRMRFLRMRHRKHFRMNDVAVKTDCGAAMCIAGHALELAGYTRRLSKESYSGDYEWFTPSGQKVADVLSVAQRELGLTYEQAQQVDYDNRKNSGLFLRFDLRTPKQAAREIEKMIAAD